MIQELDLAPGERARFISDIHFGHAKALAREPEELGFLLEGCSHLVVCGDLSETRESPCREEGLENGPVPADVPGCRGAARSAGRQP
nr:hypothetical protein [Akkermansia muciniphila]